MDYALIGIGITLVGYLVAFVAGYNKVLQQFKDHSDLDLKQFQSMERLLTEKNTASLKYHESHFEKIGKIESKNAAQDEINKAKTETLIRVEEKMDKVEEKVDKVEGKVDKLLEWLIKHNQV